MLKKKALMALSFIGAMLISSLLFAEGAGAEAVNSKPFAWAAGISIGIAALGGAIGQGLTAFSALSGIARNPAASQKVFTPMILGLAFIESLVLFALVIAFKLA